MVKLKYGKIKLMVKSKSGKIKFMVKLNMVELN